jgi:hypothetical protein
MRLLASPTADRWNAGDLSVRRDQGGVVYVTSVDGEQHGPEHPRERGDLAAELAAEVADGGVLGKLELHRITAGKLAGDGE